MSDSKAVSAGYFETMQIPVLAGKGCERFPIWATVVVNRSFVNTFLAGQSPLGRHLALAAILLASLGLYGTLSYFVIQRRREVGLRLAIGAVPAQILNRFLQQGLAVAAIGCVVGLALAAALSRLVSGLLFGISSADPASYAAVAVLMLVVAALASILPAARAARLDPMRALRED